MTHVACRLTAKDRDQLRNPTLGNRVWATFLSYRIVGTQKSDVVLVRGGDTFMASVESLNADV